MEKGKSTIAHHLSDGEKLMETKLYDRSMIEFSKAMSIDSNDAQKGLDEIFQRCLGAGNSEGVIAVGSNLLVKHPENVEMANTIGNAYRKSGELVQAEKLYTHCLKYDPKNQNAAYNLAATMAHSDLYDNAVVSAISEFESLTNFKLPDDTDGEEKLTNIQKIILGDKPTEQEGEAANETSSSDTPANEETNDSASTSTEQKNSEESKENLSEEAKNLKEEPVENDSTSTSAEQKNSEEPKENLSEEAKNLKEEPVEEEQKKEEPLEIVPLEIFKYLRSKMDLESEEGASVILSLGYYCLVNNQADIAWRALTRLAFSRPNDETIGSFVALAQAAKKEKTDFGKLISFLGKHPYNRYAHVNLGYLYLKDNNLLLARKYFILTKVLLDKSEGYYDIEEYRAVGDQYSQENAYAPALKIYNVIITENETIGLLTAISDINIKIEQYNDALVALDRIVELSPDDGDVKNTLKELNQTFLNQAESLITENKYAKAFEFLEFSGKVERTTELIQRMITVANLMKDENKIILLNEELAYLKKQEFAQEQEMHRQAKIKEALGFERKKPHKAIEAYEAALRLKADKAVFLRLAKLYEKTRQAGKVEELTKRYNKMVERENRLAQYEQDLQRSKRAAAEEPNEEKKEPNEEKKE